MEEKRKATEAAPISNGKGSKYSLHLQGNGAVNPLDAALAEVTRKSADLGLHLPIDGFSNEVQAYINEVTDVYQTSRDAVTTSCMTTAGTAIGQAADINDGRYHNRCNLFVCYAAPSGSNKSETMDAPTRPLRDRNRIRYASYQDELSEWKRNGKKDTPRPQPYLCIVGGDATFEAITTMLSGASWGILQNPGELYTVFGNMERYNKNAGPTSYLDIHDGRDLTVNRKGSDTLYVERPFLSLMGTTQPGVLRKVFSEQMVAAGLPQRFLFVYEDEPKMVRFSERTLDKGIMQHWGNLIGSFFDLPQMTLHIKDEARRIYGIYYDEVQQARMSSDAYMAAALSKNLIHVERLAGIIHFLNRNPTDSVTADEMSFAVSMMHYYARTQAKVRDVLVGDNTATLTKADIVRLIFSNFKTASQSAVAAALGIDRGNLSRMLKG